MLNDEGEEPLPPQPPRWQSWLTFGGIVALVFWWWNVTTGSALGGLNEVGDAFGVATSAFTGLAFWGVLEALRWQRYEVQLIRRETREAQKQLAEQKAINKRQADHLDRQQRDATFFELLRIHLQVNDTFEGPNFDITGRHHLLRIARAIIKEEQTEQFRLKSAEYFAAYSRSVYNLLEYVSRHEPIEAVHLQILWSTISQVELELLAYGRIADVSPLLGGRTSFEADDLLTRTKLLGVGISQHAGARDLGPLVLMGAIILPPKPKENKTAANSPTAESEAI